MKVRELATIIANMGAMAASLGQIATSTQTMGGKEVVIVEADDLMSTSKRLLEFCNALGELVPDLELEFDDASHRNDKR